MPNVIMHFFGHEEKGNVDLNLSLGKMTPFPCE